MTELKEYLERDAEIVFEWYDAETEARGWLVINSLRNGAAGGGTRMREGLTKEEVVALAKVMEIKFTVSGPAIGGAKSGIDFDPTDPRRDEVLQRWFKAIYPLLKNYYGTGGDLNVDEIKDVIPITEKLGLEHPQEGVINGHFNYRNKVRRQAIGQLQVGCSKVIDDERYAGSIHPHVAVSDMITGFGVAESVRHYYEISHKIGLEGKRVIIQGWGNVASSAAYFLTKNGANLVAIIDKDGGIISETGMYFDKVEQLFLQKQGNKLYSDQMIPSSEMEERVWDVPCDVFIPAAASRLVTRDQVVRLIKGGIEVIACGANVPFADDDVFFGPTAQFTDNQISLLPDFIVNSGMARTFAFLMSKNQLITDENIFLDVSHTIKESLSQALKLSANGKSITKTAIGIAIQKLNQF